MSRRRSLAIIAAAGLGFAGSLLALLVNPSSNPQPSHTAATTTITNVINSQGALIIMSKAFKNGERIPTKYTCDGENISPSISWENASKVTKTFALILDDPDVPNGTFTHWVIYNIPISETGLVEKIPPDGTLTNSAVQGKNGAGRIGYTGPCPSSGTHRYQFHLYALDTQLSLPAGATKGELLSAMEGHVLAQAELTGLYSRT